MRRAPIAVVAWAVVAWAVAVPALVCGAPAHAQSAPPGGAARPPGLFEDELGTGPAVGSAVPAAGARPAAGTPSAAIARSAAQGQQAQAGGSQPAPSADGGAARPALDPYTPLEDDHRAWRNPVAAPGQAAPGYRPFHWRPGRVGIISGRAYKTTYVELPACEVVVGAWVGDEGAFVLRAPGVGMGNKEEAAKRAGFPLNSVQITPRVSKSDTSLHIRTRSGRLYMFQVFAENLQHEHVTDLTVEVVVDGACESSAGAGGAAAAPPPGADFVRTIPFDVAKLRRGQFRTWGADQSVSWLVPDEILTDGHWVLLDFGDRADTMAKPAAMVVVDGAARPASQRWIGDRSQILAIRNPTDVMMLQSGQSVVCIKRVADGASPAPASVPAFVVSGGPPE